MKKLFHTIRRKSLLLTPAAILIGICGYAAPVETAKLCTATLDWNADTWFSFVEAAVALLSLVVICWGGYVAVKQLKISAESAKFAAFCRMNEVLRQESARERRKRLYALFDDETCQLKVPFDKWSEQDRKDVHDALAEIDRVGQIIKYGFLDYDSMGGWDHAIYKVLRIAEPLRREEEEKYSFEDPKNPGKRKSHYYPGIQELIRLRKHRPLFDFEKKTGGE